MSLDALAAAGRAYVGRVTDAHAMPAGRAARRGRWCDGARCRVVDTARASAHPRSEFAAAHPLFDFLSSCSPCRPRASLRDGRQVRGESMRAPSRRAVRRAPWLTASRAIAQSRCARCCFLGAGCSRSVGRDGRVRGAGGAPRTSQGRRPQACALGSSGAPWMDVVCFVLRFGDISTKALARH